MFIVYLLKECFITHLLSKTARGNNIFMWLDCEAAVDDDIVKVNVIYTYRKHRRTIDTWVHLLMAVRDLFPSLEL